MAKRSGVGSVVASVALCAVGLAVMAFAQAAPAGAESATSAARARLRAASPDGKRVAEVRPRGAGHAGEALFVDGRPRWPAGDASAPSGAEARAHTRVTSPVVWSRRGDAIAFVAEGRPGAGARAELVVLIVSGEASPAELAWPLPEAARPARAVVWLGPTRVGVGQEELTPRVVASWQTAR